MSLIGLISTPTFSNKPRINAKTGVNRVDSGYGSAEQTWPCLRVSKQIFPEVVVVLLFCKLDGLNGDEQSYYNEIKGTYPLHISKPLDYQCQRLLVVAHFTQ